MNTLARPFSAADLSRPARRSWRAVGSPLRPEVSTLPVLLKKFQSAVEGRLYGPQAAIGTVITLPVLILGVLIQKHLIKGFSFGMMRT